jgi:hypothetical protein
VISDLVAEKKMNLDSLISTFAGVASIVFLVSLLYWLHEIGADVNSGLPESQRINWKFLQMVPPFKIHWIWKEHMRLFPSSRKRLYVALSLLLLFLIPIGVLTMNLLRMGTP